VDASFLTAVYDEIAVPDGSAFTSAQFREICVVRKYFPEEPKRCFLKLLGGEEGIAWINDITESCRVSYREDPFVQSSVFPLRVKAAFMYTVGTLLNESGLFKCVFCYCKTRVSAVNLFLLSIGESPSPSRRGRRDHGSARPYYRRSRSRSSRDAGSGEGSDDGESSDGEGDARNGSEFVGRASRTPKRNRAAAPRSPKKRTMKDVFFDAIKIWVAKCAGGTATCWYGPASYTTSPDGGLIFDGYKDYDKKVPLGDFVLEAINSVSAKNMSHGAVMKWLSERIESPWYDSKVTRNN
jgi:hypothetical protein